MTPLTGELLHTHPGDMVISVRTRYWLADCLGALGEFTEGLACGAEAVRIAEAAGHLYSAILARARLGQLTLRKGDLQHAIPMLECALAHCRAADIPLFLDELIATLGLAYALSGRITEVLPLLERVVVYEDSGRGGNACMTTLGEAYLLAGCLEDALQFAERALVLARDRKERGNQAWTLRLLGEIAAHRHPPDILQTETSYHQALFLATELGMRPLQAHCHLGLGTLYATTGRRGAGPRRPGRRHRALPRHGDDLLAAAGRSHTGTGGRSRHAASAAIGPGGGVSQLCAARVMVWHPLVVPGAGSAMAGEAPCGWPSGLPTPALPSGAAGGLSPPGRLGQC